MFSGQVTRSFALCVVLVQVLVSVVLAAVIPAPQSMARESGDKVAWEPSDIMLAAHDVRDASDVQDAALEGEQRLFEATHEPDTCGMPLERLDGAESEGMPDAIVDEIGAWEGENGTGCYSGDQFRQLGVIYDGGVRYTWYSQRTLPGEGLSIEGRHVSEEGYVVDSQERIVVASSDVPQGTELAVPFGMGRAIVLDSGCVSGTVDVYTDF